MLTTLKDKAHNTALALSEINDFSFEDLEEALSNRTINYKLLHMNTPIESVIQDYNKPYFDCKIDFYIYDLDKQYNAEERVIKWDELEPLGYDFIKSFTADPAIAMLIDRKITLTRGHYEHQDSLIGIKFSFNVRFFECHH